MGMFYSMFLAGLFFRYALVPRGESPGVRVGHTCTYLPSITDNQGKGKILIVGGANPNGSFSDSHIIDLDTHEWAIPEWEGLLPRYEHTSFVPDCSPNSLWVFGGAEQSGNRNCIQVLNLDTGTWRSVTVRGTPPSARTYHTCTASIGDKLYVFGGGDTGAQPVDDAKLHVFDAATLTWSQPDTQGKAPSPRHGHVIVAVGLKLYIHGGLAGDKFYSDLYCINTTTLTWSQPDTQGKAPSPRHGHVIVAVGLKLYIHGGLAGDKFYSDLYCINTTDLQWERVKVKGGAPPGCAAHSAVSLGKCIYISGGMDASGALNTMYKYHTEKQRWTLLKFECPPAKRLDHSMCVIPWADPKASCPQAACGDQECKDSAQQAADNAEEKSSSASRSAPVHLCFVFGGMDTEGSLYNDCIVTLLD
ncbi:RABEK protein, partial [Polyodon spathula]|nr:RABEK protein [Polyodon spathula]